MVNAGLDGVVVAETVLSRIDGARGRLTYRGRDLGDIAGRISFEGAAALLWDGLSPVPESGESVLRALAEARRTE